MLTPEIKTAFESFGVDSEIVSVGQITAGLINATYLIETANKEKYILQKINTFVFKNPAELMENIVGVTKYLAASIDAITLNIITAARTSKVRSSAAPPYLALRLLINPLIYFTSIWFNFCVSSSVFFRKL